MVLIRVAHRPLARRELAHERLDLRRRAEQAHVADGAIGVTGPTGGVLNDLSGKEDTGEDRDEPDGELRR